MLCKHKFNLTYVAVLFFTLPIYRIVSLVMDFIAFHSLPRSLECHAKLYTKKGKSIDSHSAVRSIALHSVRLKHTNILPDLFDIHAKLSLLKCTFLLNKSQPSFDFPIHIPPCGTDAILSLTICINFCLFRYFDIKTSSKGKQSKCKLVMTLFYS